jgi:hypothetical protein
MSTDGSKRKDRPRVHGVNHPHSKEHIDLHTIDTNGGLNWLIDQVR